MGPKKSKHYIYKDILNILNNYFDNKHCYNRNRISTLHN